MALKIHHFASGTPDLVRAVDDIASLSAIRMSAGGYEGRRREPPWPAWGSVLTEPFTRTARSAQENGWVLQRSQSSLRF